MRRYFEHLAEFVASRSNVKVALVRPTAVYGPHDDFNPVTSHVIPALVRRAVEKVDPFEVWGTGDEMRDFLHVEDFARGCLLAMEKHADCDPINIGYGSAITIRRVVEIILEAAGHSGAQLRFDATKPTAIPVRLVDTSKAKRLLGFEPHDPDRERAGRPRALVRGPSAGSRAARASDRPPDRLRIGLVQEAAELDPVLLEDFDPAIVLQPMQRGRQPCQEIADVMAAHGEVIDEVRRVVPFVDRLDEHAELSDASPAGNRRMRRRIVDLLQGCECHDHAVGRNLDV